MGGALTYAVIFSHKEESVAQAIAPGRDADEVKAACRSTNAV
jgi:hypothetical protein